MKWKIDPSSLRHKNAFFLLMLLLLAAHLPFLQADPDISISFSRGPFTDEGLNTIQVRNWINHGYLDLEECDNLLKTPLLGFPLALTFKIFGTGHTVARLHVMGLVLLAIFIIGMDHKHRGFISIFILLTLFQYQVFQFTHFSLAEMLSVASVLLSVHFLARSADIQYIAVTRKKYAVLSGLFLSLSYFIKIQFIYLVILLPIVQLLRLIKAPGLTRKLVIRQGLYTSATLLVFLAVYFFGWYLPNRQAYDFMMANQSGEFSISAKTMEYVRFNLAYFFLKGWFLWFAFAFILCLAAGFLVLRSNHSSRYPMLFLASFSWFLLETHKLTMVYLPTRYQVSLFVSMGLLMSIVLKEIISGDFKIPGIKSLPVISRSLAAMLILLLLTINIFNYFSVFHRRTYVITETNAYLKSAINPGDVVIGAWAPSLTWSSRARALPVWNHFLNYQDPLERFKPRVVIAETDEQDSEQAYSSQGILLQDQADSTMTVRIGQWDVRVYWMKE